MKYMLLIYSSEADWTEEERAECMSDSTRLCEELAAKGQFVAASPLQGVDMATSVRLREGETLVTDGPFAETHEQLGGYFVVDMPNLDEAIALARRIPSAQKGTVEIRPVLEIEGIPSI